MRILLDTHVVLWALADCARLSPKARELLSGAGNECGVSSASVWEIAIRIAIGKYQPGLPLTALEGAIYAAGFRTLDVAMRHAGAIETVAVPHADPFDRLLLAKCEVETLRLLTADRKLSKMPVAVAC